MTVPETRRSLAARYATTPFPQYEQNFILVLNSRLELSSSRRQENRDTINALDGVGTRSGQQVENGHWTRQRSCRNDVR